MAITLEHLPESIDANVIAEIVAETLVHCTSELEDETLDVSQVQSVTIDSHGATVIYGTSSPRSNCWGGTAESIGTREALRHGGEDYRKSWIVGWAERLGLDPLTVTTLTIFGNYVEATTFRYFHDEEYGDVKRLRDGGEPGYLKAVIDIPII